MPNNELVPTDFANALTMERRKQSQPLLHETQMQCAKRQPCDLAYRYESYLLIGPTEAEYTAGAAALRWAMPLEGNIGVYVEHGIEVVGFGDRYPHYVRQPTPPRLDFNVVVDNYDADFMQRWMGEVQYGYTPRPIMVLFLDWATGQSVQWRIRHNFLRNLQFELYQGYMGCELQVQTYENYEWSRTHIASQQVIAEPKRPILPKYEPLLIEFQKE